MSNLILILLALLLGIALRRLRLLPDGAHRSLNGFVLCISLPALILVQIPRLLRETALDTSLLIPISMAWILFGASVLYFRALGQALRWDRRRVGALTLTAGLGNTSFVGFPLLEWLLGSGAIAVGVLVDQLGSFLVLSTAGLIFAARLSDLGGSPSSRVIARKVLGFPPFASLLLAALWFATGTSDAPAAVAALERLGATLVPIALVAVGLQLRVSPTILRKHAASLGLGLSFKLVLAPAFFVLLYSVLLGSHSPSTQVTLLEAAMAPMITSAVVAEEFGFDAELASLMVGIGIPLSLVTVPLWNLLLSR